MELLRILLTCPKCGGHNWQPHEYGFRCYACDEVCTPEEMCSAVFEVPRNN